jgi:nucleotide-binding universal stress UspA family protein
MDVDLVLAPVDGSDDAEAAVDYAVAVARRYDAALHLLHVVDPRLQEGIAAGDVTADSVAAQHRSFTESVRSELETVDLSTSTAVGFSTDRLSQTPGRAVLDAADELGADFLVVPRERTSGEEGTLARAVFSILQYASQPVLSV